jgi:predicted DNA-binding protein with PD1-like motif
MVVFDIGEEAAHGLKQFAETNQLRGSHFTALGAFQDVTLGWWNWETRDYESIKFEEQVEALSLVGNIARAPDDGLTVHAHVVIGRRDGRAYGGHLLEAHVRPVLEVTIVEAPEQLQRRRDARTGLALLEP